MTDGAGVLFEVVDSVGVEVEVNVLVDFSLVEKLVKTEGVDVMVLSVPEMVANRVLGEWVVVNVLSVPPDVDTNVRVRGSVPVGVVTTVCAVSVPPTVVVKLVTGGVVTRVTGVPLIVSTIVVGPGVMVTTVGVPPMLVVMVYDTGWNGAPTGVVTTTCVTGVPPMISTAV
jgi:hypothetical protein